MKIEGSFTLRASLPIVWDYLLNIEEMSQCIPGVKVLETVDATNYRGMLQVTIGPIKAKFGGTVTLLEIEPPRRLVAAFEADDKGNASKVKASFISVLNPIAEGTEVTYIMDVNMRGRLAQFGQAVVKGTAKKMVDVFRGCVQKKLSAREGE